MKQLSKSFFAGVFLILSASQANAALTHFVADPSQSQFSGSMSIAGQIHVLSNTSVFSSSGTFAGPVSGTVNANVDTLGGTFGFQDIALSSSISGSLSPSVTIFGVPLTLNIDLTNATINLAAIPSLSPLTASGTAGSYLWGPTAMTLDVGVDYSTALSAMGLIGSSFSSTVMGSMTLADATGSVALDASGNPVAYTLGTSSPLAFSLPSWSSTANGVTVTITNSSLTLNDMNLVLRGNSTVVPVPAAVWLFGSGLLGLIGVARRRRPLRAMT